MRLTVRHTKKALRGATLLPATTRAAYKPHHDFGTDADDHHEEETNARMAAGTPKPSQAAGTVAGRKTPVARVQKSDGSFESVRMVTIEDLAKAFTGKVSGQSRLPTAGKHPSGAPWSQIHSLVNKQVSKYKAQGHKITSASVSHSGDTTHLRVKYQPKGTYGMTASVRHSYGPHRVSKSDALAKSNKKGAGSRGGNVIGHTKSGKPVYGPSKKQLTGGKSVIAKEAVAHAKKHSKGFTKRDHLDAQALHRVAEKTATRGAKGKSSWMTASPSPARWFHSAAKKHHYAESYKQGPIDGLGAYGSPSYMRRMGYAKSESMHKSMTASGKPIAPLKMHPTRSNTALLKPEVHVKRNSTSYTAQDHLDAAAYHTKQAAHPSNAGNRQYDHQDIATAHKQAAASLSKSRHNETTENVMSGKNPIADLFTDELAKSGEDDKPIVDCPHCDTPITKSEVLAKSRVREAAAQNNGGKTAKEGKPGTHSTASPTRSKVVAAERQKPKVTGSLSKGDDGADDENDGGENDDADTVAKSDCAKCGAGKVCKCMNKSEAKPQPRAAAPMSPFVNYVNSGADAEAAKMIEEGRFGTDRAEPLNVRGR